MGKTSSASKYKWIKENYIQIRFYMGKEDGRAFKEKCEKEGVAQAEILRQAAYDFLGKPVPPSKARF